MGWLESWRRWEGEGGEGGRGVRSRGSLGEAEKSSHTGAALRAYQGALDAAFAEAAKANQMQPRLLGATRCQVQPGSAWGAAAVQEGARCSVQTQCRWAPAGVQWSAGTCGSSRLDSILLKSLEGFVVSLQLLRPDRFVLCFRLTGCEWFVAGVSKAASVCSVVFWSLGIPRCLSTRASSSVYRILSHFLQC